MNSKDNPLTEHDANFLKACIDAVDNHPHDGVMETAYNLSLMFHHAVLRLAHACSDGRDAGLVMLMCVIDEAKQDAIKQLIAEDMEEEEAPCMN
jgi:hypothetical protein